MLPNEAAFPTRGGYGSQLGGHRHDPIQGRPAETCDAGVEEAGSEPQWKGADVRSERKCDMTDMY